MCVLQCTLILHFTVSHWTACIIIKFIKWRLVWLKNFFFSSFQTVPFPLSCAPQVHYIHLLTLICPGYLWCIRARHFCSSSCATAHLHHTQQANRMYGRLRCLLEITADSQTLMPENASQPVSIPFHLTRDLVISSLPRGQHQPPNEKENTHFERKKDRVSCIVIIGAGHILP